MGRIYTPVGHQILCKRIDGDKRTAGGLHLPERRNDEGRGAVEGEVLAVGPGDFDGYFANPDYRVAPGPERDVTRNERGAIETVGGWKSARCC